MTGDLLWTIPAAGMYVAAACLAASAAVCAVDALRRRR
jgi:hypothetical protein